MTSRREFVRTAGAVTGALLTSRSLGALHLPDAQPAPGIVVFQGDSITDGWRVRTVAEPNVPRALGTGYPLLVAAALMRARPSAAWRFYNRGVSGDKVPDLQARWTADTLDLRPDILTVLVGVNDFWHRKLRNYPGTVASYERELGTLLDSTRRALPNVRLFVLEPFVLRTGHVDDSWFPEFDQRRAAAARAARDSGAAYVPLQSSFDALARETGPAYWAADGVHPTPAGNEVIADALLREMRG